MKKQNLFRQLFFATLFCVSLSLNAQTSMPQGKWEATQITIERNVDGNTETTVYNSVTEVRSFIPFAQMWEIGAEEIVLHFSDGMEAVTDYTLEDNLLTIRALGAILLYRLYSVNENELTLTATHNYAYNSPNEGLINIEEQWTIHLRKK